jgi:hypothetical protein
VDRLAVVVSAESQAISFLEVYDHLLVLQRIEKFESWFRQETAKQPCSPPEFSPVGVCPFQLTQ